MSRRTAAIAAVALAALCGCSALSPAAPRPSAASAVPPGALRIGFAAPTPGGVATVAALAGVHPAYVSTYASFGQPFPQAWARAAEADGATLVIQLDTAHRPLASVTSGAYDGWLRSWAKAIRAVHYPVAIGLDHEFNGPWWPWSYEHETPGEFTAMWRHVVGVVRGAGARVAWTWTISNVTGPQAAGVAAYWPGAAYVTYAGVNAYYYRASDTFGSVMSPALAEVRAVTSDPVLITETGANPAAGRARSIADLARGIASTPGILGLIWFDYAKWAGHDWRIDGDPAALAAFRAAARQYGEGP